MQYFLSFILLISVTSGTNFSSRLFGNLQELLARPISEPIRQRITTAISALDAYSHATSKCAQLEALVGISSILSALPASLRVETIRTLTSLTRDVLASDSPSCELRDRFSLGLASGQDLQLSESERFVVGLAKNHRLPFLSAIAVAGRIDRSDVASWTSAWMYIPDDAVTDHTLADLTRLLLEEVNEKQCFAVEILTDEDVKFCRTLDLFIQATKLWIKGEEIQAFWIVTLSEMEY